MIFEKIIEIAKYYDWESIFRGSLNKRKKIPKLDENGNPILLENGKIKMVSIKTNDWDRKSLVSEIRKDWADKSVLIVQYLKILYNRN